MKVAITADLHLTMRAENPERFHALEQILGQLALLEVQDLIIAGDVFDASRNNYGELESLCRQPEFGGFRFHIIRGNHDLRLGRGGVVADNVTFYDKPQLTKLPGIDLPFFFLPYERGRTMGERLAEHREELPTDQWILVGHGDWSDQLRSVNLYEPGVYMPLTRRDIDLFRPALAILGHIHAPTDRAPIYYPGSPCPLDITETGHRRFLVYDCERRTVTPVKVPTDVVYFHETFTVLPIDDELVNLQEAIKERIAAWGLQDGDDGKVRVRVKARGYCADRDALKKTLDFGFAPFRFHDGQGSDIAEVSTASDPGRAYLAKRVRDLISEADVSRVEHQPSRDDVVLEALRIIYGA
jgi:DNA repair exonuclease SbcCD nuclease subunit